MSQRLGSFCDFQCDKPAKGTCFMCKHDYCADHSISDKALRVSVALVTRVQGSNQLADTKLTFTLRGMCKTCSDGYSKAVAVQEAAVEAAADSATIAIAAKLSELALKAEAEAQNKL